MSATPTDARTLQTVRDKLRLAAQERLLEDIPLARFIQLRIAGWDGATLDMQAPLAPNINDKGCAFGGSLASVMTLACWSMIKLAADERSVQCDIYVQDSKLRYLAPIWQDFIAQARLSEDQDLAASSCIGDARQGRLATAMRYPHLRWRRCLQSGSTIRRPRATLIKWHNRHGVQKVRQSCWVAK